MIMTDLFLPSIYKIAENTKIGQFCQTSQNEILIPYPDANKLTVTVSIQNILNNYDYELNLFVRLNKKQ